MHRLARIAAAFAITIGLACASLAITAEPAAAACRVNHYFVLRKSPVFYYPSGSFYKYKWYADRVTGPNSNVMVNVYSTYYRIVYLANGSLGFMPKADLRYVSCS